MRAVRVTDDGVQIVERPLPAVAEPVRVASVGICASDLHLAGMGVPVTLGHEVAGRAVSGVPVAVHPLRACGDCPACFGGHTQLCEQGGRVILGVGLDGGMADWVEAPAAALVALPPGLDVHDGCLVEPMAVSVHGIRRVDLRSGERVCVIGGGAIGLTAAAAANDAGAEVTVLARHSHQQNAAADLGVRVARDSDQCATSDFDVVVDAAGTADALGRSTQLCRSGGRVLALANYWEPVVALDTTPLVRREVSIVPSRMYGSPGPGSDFAEAARLLAARPDIARVLITHRFPLSDAAAAFALVADRSRPSLKVVLEP
jgi:2-desacetyl-2-hydroxyethyl bacteriochlorophyllide A dehydrogenase